MIHFFPMALRSSNNQKFILTHYQVPNNLNRYLSTLSDYKHPTMEEIYEAARIF